VTMSDTGADFTEPTALASILLTRLGSYTLVRHPPMVAFGPPGTGSLKRTPSPARANFRS